MFLITLIICNSSYCQEYSTKELNEIRSFLVELKEAGNQNSETKLSELIHHLTIEKGDYLKKETIRRIIDKDKSQYGDLSYSNEAMNIVIDTLYKQFHPISDKFYDNYIARGNFGKDIANMERKNIVIFSGCQKSKAEYINIILIKVGNNYKLLFWEGLNYLILKGSPCCFDKYESIKSEIQKFEIFNNYKIRTDIKPFCLYGNFLGDRVTDLIVLLKDKDDKGAIGIIKRGKPEEAYILGDSSDPFQIFDYSWIGVFEKIDPYEVLWSNYTEGFRSFEDVPENEKIKIHYNSFFIHASESCGGGFIFWKDNKWNWLQQE
jgi:hypothetical protein